jgi:hypothetical protein
MPLDNYEVLNDASQQEDNLHLKKFHKDKIMPMFPNN